jgi:hypothetical protein
VPQSVTVKTNQNTLVLNTTDAESTLRTDVLNLDVDTLKLNGNVGHAGQVLTQGATGPYWENRVDVSGATGRTGNFVFVDTSGQFLYNKSAETPYLKTDNGTLKMGSDLNMNNNSISNCLQIGNQRNPGTPIEGFFMYNAPPYGGWTEEIYMDGRNNIWIDNVNGQNALVYDENGILSSLNYEDLAIDYVLPSTGTCNWTLAPRELTIESVALKYLTNTISLNANNGITINGSAGSAGQVLTKDAFNSMTWATPPSTPDPQWVGTAAGDLDMGSYDIFSYTNGQLFINKTGIILIDASGITNSMTQGGLNLQSTNGSYITLTHANGLNINGNFGWEGYVLTKDASNNMTWAAPTADFGKVAFEEIELLTTFIINNIKLDYLLWVKTVVIYNIPIVYLPSTTVVSQKITIRNDSDTLITASAQSTNTIHASNVESTVDIPPHSAMHFYCADNTPDAVKWIII